MSKKPNLSISTNGAIARVHNKRIAFQEKDGKFMIQFNFADANADTPACGHKSYRGKVRETFVQMSPEAMEILVYSYTAWKRERFIEEQQKESKSEGNEKDQH